MKAGQLRKKIGWPCVLLSSVIIAILRLKSHGPESCIEAYIAKDRYLLTKSMNSVGCRQSV